MALALARYRDRATGFGWNLARGPASLSFVNTRNWGNSFGAFNFAAGGPQAALLLTRAASVPPEVFDYMQELRSGPANQGFVFGGKHSISSAALRQLDRVLGSR